MSTIVTRTANGSPLTILQLDANFTNLNSDKAETANPTFTGAVKIDYGTAAAPALAFSGSTNTGIYGSGTGLTSLIGVSFNGTTVAEIDSSARFFSATTKIAGSFNFQVGAVKAGSSGSNAVSIGNNNTMYGAFPIAIGAENIVNSQSVAIGANHTVNTVSSTAIGSGVTSAHDFQVSFANWGLESGQRSVYCLRADTSDNATPTLMSMFPAYFDVASIPVIASLISLKGQILVRDTTTVGSALFDITIMSTNQVLRGVVITPIFGTGTLTLANLPASKIQVVTSTGTLAINVTGLASKNLVWLSTLDATGA